MRDDEDTDAVIRRRLAHLIGAQPTGWTPDQPSADAAPGVDWRERWRVAAPLPALKWLLAAGVAVVLVAGYLLTRHHSVAVAEPPPATSSLPTSSSLPTGVASSASVVVDVGGRVRHPGLVTLPAGARVADAIAAAGGALRPGDLTTINLAARVNDGELLLVGVPGGGTGGTGAAGSAGGPVDLNSASVDQLDALPGVGPVLAQRIVSWRQQHGGFRTVDELQQVPGIGARKFDDLKPLVTV